MYLNKFSFPSRFIFAGDDGIDLDKVKDFFKSNKDSDDVKTYVSALNPLTEDRIKGYLETDDTGKKLAGKLFDSRVTAGIKKFEKTFNEEKLSGLVEEAYKSKHPEESELDKSNRKLAAQVTALEEKNRISELKGTALELITEAKLPFTKIVDKFIGIDEESTASNIDAFKSIWDSEIDTEVKKRMAGDNGRDPHGSDPKPKPKLETLEKEYEEARKAGKTLDMVRIKNQMFEAKLKEANEKNDIK